MVCHARVTIDCDLIPRMSAAYLRLAGDECAFVEAHTARALPKLLEALDAAGRRPEEVRWVIVTHAHLDHAGGASALLARCPNATLLAHPSAAKNLIDPSKLVRGATAVYGEARFRALYGSVDPIPAERVRALDDGATFELGGATLTVHHTAGHAWHHFVVDDPAIDTVFTGDAFGLAYPALQRAGRFAIASTSPTGFDAKEAKKSLEKIVRLGRQAACLTHFDEVRDLDEVARQVGAWIDRSESWREEATASGEPYEACKTRIEAKLRAAVDEDARARGLALGPSDWALLAIDMDLNAQGLALVAVKAREES